MDSKSSTFLVKWAEKSWILDTRRVLINPNERLLILSDIHIGYYSSFRAQGSYLPTYDADILQETIENLLVDYPNYHWIMAGDIKHNHKKHLSEREYEELKTTLQKIKEQSQLTILLGNHDKGLEQVLDDLKVKCEVQESYSVNNYTITHKLDLQEQKGKNFIIGHVHPILSVGMVKGMFVPIFAIAQDLLILPAFNYVAGGINLKKLVNIENLTRNFSIYAIRNKIYDLGKLDSIPS